MKTKLRYFSIAAVLFFVLFAFNNCGPSAFFTTPQNRLEEGSGGSTVGNPSFTFSVASYSENLQIELCVDQMRLTPTTGTPYSYIAYQKTVSINQSGATLEPANLNGATFIKMELELVDNCGTGYAIRVTNPNGTFMVLSGVMQFRGSLNSAITGQLVNLTLQDLAYELERVSTDAQITNVLNIAYGLY